MEGHHRHSIRLPGADYSIPGFYFVTICTKKREHLFGEVVDAEMRLNDFGRIVQQEWEKTAELRPGIITDEFVVMPNHVHGIVLITDTNRTNGVGIDCINPTQSPIGRVNGIDAINPYNEPIHRYGPQSDNLFAIVRGFKGAVTRRINGMRGGDTPVWQPRFHDHIIRDQKSLEKIRTYIRSNPFNWQMDLDNIVTQHTITEMEYIKKSREHFRDLFGD